MVGGGGRGKRGREVSTVGKTLRGLTGGEVVQASPSIAYKPDDLLHLHCKNKCVILAKYFATTIVCDYPSLRKLT